MRNMIAALSAILLTSPAFAHSGHGEVDALHHGLFSGLNLVDPLPLLAVVAIAAAVLTKRFR